MLAEVSKNQAIDSKDKGFSFHLPVTFNSDKKYNLTKAAKQFFSGENALSTTFDQEKCLKSALETFSSCSRDISISTKDCALINFSYLAKHVLLAFRFCEKRNVCENKEKIFYLAEKYLKEILPKGSYISEVNRIFIDIFQSYNLEDILNCWHFPTHGMKWNFNDQFLKITFPKMLYATVNWKVASNALLKEKILTTHLASSSHPKNTKRPMLQNHPVKINKPFSVRSFISTQHNGSEISTANQLKLQCVFTNNADLEGIISDVNKSWVNEDIKMILPMSWNISVACNAITISDENNQNIRLFFRSVLKATVDYKNCNLSSSKIRPSSAVESKTNVIKNKETIRSYQTTKIHSLPSKTTVVKREERTIYTNRNKKLRDSFEEENVNKMKKSFLPLQEPVLLKYTEGIKIKHVLIYKAHYFQKISNGNKSFYKILEDLLARSVRYDADPVNLVFEPRTLINRLKREGNNNYNPISAHSSIGMHNLMENCELKNSAKPENFQKFNKTQKDRKANSVPRIIHTAREHRRLWNKISRRSVKSHKCSNMLNSSSSLSIVKSNEMSEIFRENKPNLKTFRKKKNRTALKRVNVKQIVSSVFRQFFHFYSLVGGHLKSGAVITRSNSNYWLRISGVVTDSGSLKLAEDIFTAVAGRKVVLNIFDYLKFLIAFARTRNMIVVELVKQMMVCERSSTPIVWMEKHRKFEMLKNLEDKSIEIYGKDAEGKNAKCVAVSRSLPNLKNAI